MMNLNMGLPPRLEKMDAESRKKKGKKKATRSGGKKAKLGKGGFGRDQKSSKKTGVGKGDGVGDQLQIGRAKKGRAGI
jgi:hypothetical protein